VPKVVASIEARMTSSRLPGKVLADIAGVPALTHLVNRLKKARTVDAIILATTTNASDDPLVTWAAENDIPSHRGSEDDVLARVVGAQRQMYADVVCEVCGDTPLLDPGVIDAAVSAHLAGEGDVVTTVRRPTFPEGIDAEVFSLADLEEVGRTVDDAEVREHVSLQFYRQPERYRIHDLAAEPPLDRPDLRLVLDYAEDLELIRRVLERLGPDAATTDVIALLDAEPDLRALNAQHLEAQAS